MSEEQVQQEAAEQAFDQVIERTAESPMPDVPADGVRNPEAYDKALKEERDARKALEKELKELRSAQMSEQERAIAEAKEAGFAEAKSKYEADLLKSRVASKAAAMNFHDPDMVNALLNLEGDLTDEEIIKALDGLAKDRAYLIRTNVPKMEMGPRTGADGQISAQSGSEDWFRQLMENARR